MVAAALQEHGAIIQDTGPAPGIPGEPDVRWNDVDLADLGRFTLSDFEIVDPAPMRVAGTDLGIR